MEAPAAIPDDAPTIGDGRFVLIYPLGLGGQCQVFAAWDQRLRMWRALKVLLPGSAARPKLRMRFVNEATAMQRIKHPHLIRVVAVDAESAQPWMAMELAEGGTLHSWCSTFGPMPPRMAVEACLGVAGALQTAHDAGLVHRDVKPQNLLVTHKGVCKVADFGIAQDEAARMTRAGAVFGTLGFMAPEQLEDAGAVDARADVYGLAATLFWILTQPSQHDMLQLANAAGLVERAPAALVPSLRRALLLDPNQRPASMAAFAAQLEAALPHLDLDPAGTPPLSQPIQLDDESLDLSQVTDSLDRTQPTLDVVQEAPVPRRSWEPDDGPQPSYVVEEPLRSDTLPPMPAPRPKPPPPPPRRPWWLLVPLLGAPVVAVFMCLGGLGLGHRQLTTAAAAHEDAVVELHQRLEHEQVVLEDLAALGFETEVPEQALSQWASHPTAESGLLAAVALQQAAAPILGITPPDDPDALLARQRIERVEWAAEQQRSAAAEFRDAAASPLAGLAVALGLAPTL